MLLLHVTRYQTSANAAQNTQRTDKEHELEIELDSAKLIEQGQRVRNGEPHAYQELVTGLVDNVRILARKALVVDDNRV